MQAGTESQLARQPAFTIFVLSQRPIMNRAIRAALAAVVATIIIILQLQCAPSRPDKYLSQSENLGVYHSDPNHLWNRIHRHFHTRVAPDGEVFGEDETDVLLWLETNYLLTGASHQKAIQLLDEFIKVDGQRLITDPLMRAVFQHDLWAVFDWLATTNDRYPPETRHPRETGELQVRLAKVIKSVALTKNQINALPSNFRAAVASKAFSARYDPEHNTRAFLPPEMDEPAGPWVTINSFVEPVAIPHAREFSSSAFAVMINLPGGRNATIAYLKKLWDFPEAFVADTTFPAERRLMLNPELPQFPSSTQFALIRRMLLIDADGEIVPSNLIESIQIRVFHDPSTVDYPHQGDFYGDQDFFEFRMSRRKLFAGESGGIRAVARDETGFMTFSTHGFDWFEDAAPKLWRKRRVVLEGCGDCHRNIGIRSVMSVHSMLRPNPFSEWFDAQSPFSMAAEWKRRRSDWGLMEALLRSNASRRKR